MCKTSATTNLCWLSEILWWNLKAFHYTFIISVSMSHMTACLINSNSEELFANIGVSLVRSMSCSSPTHTKVEVAGLTNDLYTRLTGFSKNVLPQLAGPIIKIFRNSPRSLCTRLFTALLNFSTDVEFVELITIKFWKVLPFLYFYLFIYFFDYFFYFQTIPAKTNGQKYKTPPPKINVVFIGIFVVFKLHFLLSTKYCSLT